jgi:hypothetical protein
METLGLGASDSVKPTHLTPRSWENWVEHYTSRGHRVLAPTYPGPERSRPSARSDQDPQRRLVQRHPLGHTDPFGLLLPQPFFYDQKPVRGTRSLTAS